MADKTISALTSASTPLAGTEVLPIVQGGTTVKVAVSDLTAARAVATAALSATGIILTTDATDASSTTAASMKTAGGLGVVKKTYVGDNIVQATAAKGFDFAANTPLAGKTSTILNWYEEGAYTPTVSCTTGAITSYTVAAAYTRIGRSVTMVANVTITAAGTGAGTLTITLPFTANASYNFNGTGRENALTGSQLQGSITGGGSVVNVVNYANASVIATNAQMRMTITYFV